jgi:hypothetical protein
LVKQCLNRANAKSNFGDAMAPWHNLRRILGLRLFDDNPNPPLQTAGRRFYIVYCYGAAACHQAVAGPLTAEISSTTAAAKLPTAHAQSQIRGRDKDRVIFPRESEGTIQAFCEYLDATFPHQFG